MTEQERKEQERKKKELQEQQILVEDSTLSAFGFTNPVEIKVNPNK